MPRGRGRVESQLRAKQSYRVQQDHRADLAALIQHPVAFSRGLLRARLWGKQERILDAITKHRRVAVKACHSSGKTYAIACAVCWWVSRYADGIVVTTAPSWTQVERVIWGRVHELLAQSLTDLPRNLRTEIRLGENNYAIGISTNEGVRFQGFHGRILVIVDEALGVKPWIWEAIEGIRAGGDVRVLAMANPTVASGPFYEAFRSPHWWKDTISAFDTPNLEGVTLEQLLAMDEDELDDNPWPFLTTRRWVREKYDEWGPGHPLWESRVMGQFPEAGEDALIPLSWLEVARNQDVEVPADAPWRAGLDVAGPGEDETALCVRHGNQIVLQVAWADRDPRGKVLHALAPFKEKGVKVLVDSVGIGFYMARHLESAGYDVVDVNVGINAHNEDKYRMLKSELSWGLRELFEARAIGGLHDERAVSQLSSIRYDHTARGQIIIESKEAMKKRGVKSPDRAEAVMLCFANSPALRLERDNPLSHIAFI